MSDSRTISRVIARRIGPLGVLTATAVLGTGLLGAAHLARDDDRPADSRAAPAPSAVAPPAPAPAPSAPLPRSSATVATVAPVDPASVIPGEGAGGPVSVAVVPISVRYTFDGGPDRPVTDTAGRFPLRVVTEAGGVLGFAAVASTAAPAAGFAMRFPPRCAADPLICPRAILEGVRDDALNPGARPMRFGASVLMSRADTGDGANVVQKGYSVGGASQFKLQVDHATAYPSCVLAGAKIYRIASRVSLADGAWHSVACSRRGSRLGITVDGVYRGSTHVPSRLSIANAEPLRIGGKGAGAGNDQFAGQIDNVLLDIA